MRKIYACLLLLTAVFITANAQVTELYSNTGGVGGTLGNRVPFIGSLGGLGVTDGTVAGTAIVVTPATVVVQFSSAISFWNNSIFFVGNDGVHGDELWVSDFTTAGTKMLKDINPGSAGSNPAGSANNKTFPVVNNSLFFIADDGTTGAQLWKTDGTSAGTVMVKDINPVGGSSANIQFSHPLVNNYVNTLYFTANDGVHGQELWESDGTTAGTAMVDDITPGSASTTFSSDFAVASINNYSYFVAGDGIHGTQLWRTDGSTGGTLQLTAINQAGGGAFSLNQPLDYLVFNNKLAFGTSTYTTNYGLWITDGTAANTNLLNSNLSPSLGSFNNSAVILNGKFYFSSGSNTGVGIWQSDGTPSGTQLFKDFSNGNVPDPAILLPGIQNSDGATQFLFQGNKFFFTAYDPVSQGLQLWISDATLAGTKLLTINPAGYATDTSRNNEGNQWLFTQGALFLRATDGVHGYELWKSDGTTAGTAMVEDINPGSASSNPNFGGVASSTTVVFSATDNTGNLNLYKVNATESALPLQMGNFTAQLKGSDVLLNWTTLQEINTAWFNVQRSTDGVAFSTIGLVKAAGNSSVPLNYAYTDAAAAALGTNKLYYRLQVQDKDDKITYTKTLPVNLYINNAPAFSLTPNPSSSSVALQFTNIAGKVGIKITDMGGRVLQNIAQNIVAGQNMPLNVKNMTAGVYLITVNYNGLVMQQKFVKQ